MTRAKGAAYAAAVSLFFAVIGCSKLTELANKASNSNTQPQAGKTWVSYDLASTDMHAELPGPPKDESPALPEAYKAFYTAMHIYAYDAKDFQSSFTELVSTGKKKFEIKTLADTSMTVMKKQLTDLDSTVDVRSPTNAHVSGSFTKGGKNLELTGCVVYKKGANPEKVWSIFALYPKDSPDLKTQAERIVASASFKDSTESCK
ncbi:MAG: hypothetical protein JO053_01340 [Acidobacteria bacterium]|nr:hypothetical protein [Acidobacteriota bacterium]